mgnify:CR=1 FL=1
MMDFTTAGDAVAVVCVCKASQDCYEAYQVGKASLLGVLTLAWSSWHPAYNSRRPPVMQLSLWNPAQYATTAMSSCLLTQEHQS